MQAACKHKNLCICMSKNVGHLTILILKTISRFQDFKHWFIYSIRVYGCVCMYLCIYVYMYVCLFMYMYACMYVYLCVSKYVYVSICVYE